MSVSVRPATAADVPALCALQARIIRIGGTTAYETPYDEDGFARAYLTGPRVICCHTARLDGRIVGFQALGQEPGLPEGWAEIGTFVDPQVQRGGAGQALFAATCAFARAAGWRGIHAAIRADNGPGLGFYARLGFVHFGSDPDFALRSGRVVGRVHRRFVL